MAFYADFLQNRTAQKQEPITARDPSSSLTKDRVNENVMTTNRHSSGAPAIHALASVVEIIGRHFRVQPYFVEQSIRVQVGCSRAAPYLQPAQKRHLALVRPSSRGHGPPGTPGLDNTRIGCTGNRTRGLNQVQRVRDVMKKIIIEVGTSSGNASVTRLRAHIRYAAFVADKRP